STLCISPVSPALAVVQLARAAAYRIAVDAKAAAAAGLEHGGHAFATRLDHFPAHLVAAGAGDAHAAVGHVGLAHSHGEVARADGHAVHHHAATDHAAAHHGAEILHHRAGRLVVASAGDLHSAGAFFHLHGTAWNHEPLRAGRHGGHATAGHRGHAHSGPFHHHARHGINSFCEKCNLVKGFPAEHHRKITPVYASIMLRKFHKS